MFPHDITIINKVYDKSTRLDKLMCHHIYGVLWEDIKAANIIKSGLEDADRATIYIPFNATGVEKYKSSSDFKKDPEGAFTLRKGDYIVKSIVEYDGPIAKLSEAFDDVITVSSIDTYDYGGLAHWKVSGK